MKEIGLSPLPWCRFEVALSTAPKSSGKNKLKEGFKKWWKVE
jgi:hypothetical protein